jgi:protein-S-isoprenylcysteine O-methyltransferase Ste14
MTQQKGQKISHQQRHDLTGEHRVGDTGQILIAILFTIIWVADTFFLQYSTFLNQIIPPGIRIPVGLILLILSGYIAGKGLAIVFGEVREEPVVIRKSVFNLVRHPIYLSEILLYLGLLILSMSLMGAFVWIIAILFLHFISRHEERLLLARFGKEYEKYKKDVPMWIPRIRPIRRK